MWTRTVTPEGLQYPVESTHDTQQDLSKQDPSRRAWKGTGPGSGTPAGKRQLQLPWQEQPCQDILEWAGSLPCQRGTLGLWDRQGTHPNVTSIRGMFWDATPKSKQQGWGTRGAWGEREGGGQGAPSHRAMPMPPCPDATVMDGSHPTYHRSPPLWGRRRVQMALESPYTPETTTPPLPGFTAATRARRGPVPRSRQPKPLQRATVEATQWFHGRSWAQPVPVPQGQVSPAVPVPTARTAAAEQCVSRPHRHCCHRHHHCHHPGLTPRQGQCHPLHQDSFMEVPPGTGTPARDSSVTPSGHCSCLKLSLAIPVSRFVRGMSQDEHAPACASTLAPRRKGPTGKCSGDIGSSGQREQPQ